MRVKWRSRLLDAVFILGLFPVAALVERALRSELALPITLVCWLVLFTALDFLICRCPNCRKWAHVTREGIGTPITGNQCRHCGTGY